MVHKLFPTLLSVTYSETDTEYQAVFTFSDREPITETLSKIVSYTSEYRAKIFENGVIAKCRNLFLEYAYRHNHDKIPFVDGTGDAKLFPTVFDYFHDRYSDALRQLVNSNQRLAEQFSEDDFTEFQALQSELNYLKPFLVALERLLNDRGIPHLVIPYVV